jgi:hypothetical protein
MDIWQANLSGVRLGYRGKPERVCKTMNADSGVSPVGCGCEVGFVKKPAHALDR